ncbi:MAG: DUF362 domain-containing protein [Butyrivibrio sp.]|nr:DUF362 domain-containing protein [Butyrivibrio sp.]
MNNYISISKTDNYEYPNDKFFRPGERYPEYIFNEISDVENHVYDAVRNALILLKMDQEHIGTKEWNPFASLIHEGDHVLIKPNLVLDQNTNIKGGEKCLYTHPSVVAPVLDYVFKALNGTGSVIIGDAPMQECDFERLIKESGYDRLITYYKEKGLKIKLQDFRKQVTVVKRRLSTRSLKDNIPSQVINLGTESEFYGIDQAATNKLRIVMYPSDNLITHHHDNIHEYCVSQYVLDADVIINMPKPKTHKKAGVTIALKNLVGINAQKDFLPHHSYGSKEEGGDEYKDRNIIQSIRSRLYDKKYILEDKGYLFKARLIWFGIAVCTTLLKIGGVKYENGSWYGNETISKTIVDLNKIILYADKNGKLQETKQRRYFIIADMIISGEKDGPVAPSPKQVGMIAAGSNPVYFDKAIASLMGFDVSKIPTLRQCSQTKSKYKFFDGNTDIYFVSNDKRLDSKCALQLRYDESLKFVPATGWKGHIEKDI